MKIFLDTADVTEIRQALELGVLDGVTTNPSLVAKVGRGMEEAAREICELVDGPVSVEVLSTEAPAMIEEARRLAGIHPNVVVKLPTVREGLKALRVLAAEKINVNMTLVFSPLQALLVAKNGARFVSPFVGRLDDISTDGMDLVGDIVQIYDNYGFETEVLVASIRHPLHVLEAARLGADVVTLPYKVLEQMIHHPLTDSGVEKFLADWRQVRRTGPVGP
ncbi:MAG TPA: fructose-6-phosphate aldolase [Acidobacteriota bacterium]|nr:fructose-6-phosphate aldolase [Acidobacteriota bacterium]